MTLLSIDNCPNYVKKKIITILSENRVWKTNFDFNNHNQRPNSVIQSLPSACFPNTIKKVKMSQKYRIGIHHRLNLSI